MKVKHLGGAFAAVLELAVGILLLVDPSIFISAIVVLAGIALFLLGVHHIILYFRSQPEVAAQGSSLAIGLGAIALAVVLMIFIEQLAAMDAVLTVVFGVVILGSGLVKIQHTVNMLRLGVSRWFLGAIAAAVTLACAALILWNPFATADVLWIFMGISLIVEALLDLASSIFGRKQGPAPVYTGTTDIVEQADSDADA